MELNDIWSVKFAALWEPEKVEQMPLPTGPDTLPLHWSGRGDGTMPYCEEESHHHWTAQDSHEDCDNRQHIDPNFSKNQVKYKNHGIFADGAFHDNAAYIVPQGHGAGFKDEMNSSYIDNLYVPLFNDRTDTNAKDNMRHWMKENNVPWVSLITPNGINNSLYVLEAEPEQYLSKEEFQNILRHIPDKTGIRFSGQGLISSIHRPDHLSDKENKCESCFDGKYSLYLDMKKDLNGTE